MDKYATAFVIFSIILHVLEEAPGLLPRCQQPLQVCNPLAPLLHLGEPGARGGSLGKEETGIPNGPKKAKKKANFIPKRAECHIGICLFLGGGFCLYSQKIIQVVSFFCGHDNLDSYVTAFVILSSILYVLLSYLRLFTFPILPIVTCLSSPRLPRLGIPLRLWVFLSVILRMFDEFANPTTNSATFENGLPY